MTHIELVFHPRTQKLIDHYGELLPHGLIVEGAVGSGVLQAAKLLARRNRSPEFVIEPKKKVKNEWVVDGKEGSIIIDDIRQLYAQTRTRQPGKQVYIIDTGEKSMTIPAQNAFLKLLEEPHPGIHFVIATHHPEQLLSTIHSRSQRLSVLPITDQQTVDMVASLAIDDPTKRARLSFVGRGRPALIKRLAVDESAYESRVKIMSDAKSLLGENTYEKLAVIHQYKDSRADALTLIDDMNYQLQTIIGRQPDVRFAAAIDRHLRTRDRIAAGGNIRLQLAADMVY